MCVWGGCSGRPLGDPPPQSTLLPKIRLQRRRWPLLASTPLASARHARTPWGDRWNQEPLRPGPRSVLGPARPTPTPTRPGPSWAQPVRALAAHPALPGVRDRPCFAAKTMPMPHRHPVSAPGPGRSDPAGLPDEVAARRGSCGDAPHPARPAGPRRVGGCGGYGPGRVRDALVAPARLALRCGSPRRGYPAGSGDGSMLQEAAELGPGGAAWAARVQIHLRSGGSSTREDTRFAAAERTQEPGAAAADGIPRIARAQRGNVSKSTPDRVLSLNRGSLALCRSALAPLRCFKVVLQVSVSGLTFRTWIGLVCPGGSGPVSKFFGYSGGVRSTGGSSAAGRSADDFGNATLFH